MVKTIEKYLETLRIINIINIGYLPENMEPYLVEIKNFERGSSIDINNIPRHSEKYLLTQEELMKYEDKNEGQPRFSVDKFLSRVLLFTK